MKELTGAFVRVFAAELVFRVIRYEIWTRKKPSLISYLSTSLIPTCVAQCITMVHFYGLQRCFGESG